MTKRPVVVIVDAAIEMSPERIKELDIQLIPRQAKVGWRTVRLDADQTANSLSELYTSPRRVTFSPLLPENLVNAYQAALNNNQDVISLHLPPGLDSVSQPSRLARNLLQRPRVRTYELPLPGIGLARLAETVARAAKQQWGLEDLASLVDRLNAMIRSYFIIPASAISKEKMLGGPVTSSFFRRPHLLAEIEPVNCDFSLHGHNLKVEALVRPLSQLADALDDHHLGVEAYIRQTKYDKSWAAVETKMKESSITWQMQPGWSPILYPLLGNKLIEICLIPPQEKLVKLMEQTKQIIQAAQRFERRNQGQRLSDFRVRLK